MNWAGFGGFATGFANGINMGKAIKEAFKEDERQKIYAQGLAEANAMRQKDIEGSVKDNGEQPKAEGAPKNVGNATGQTAPDTPEVQTAAVPQPTTTVTTPAPAPGPAPAPAAAAGPAGGIPAPGQPMPGPAAPVELPPIQVAQAQPPAPSAAPAAAAGIPAPKRFSVGDQSFDTREEALAAAGKNAPSVTDYFYKTAVPKMQEWYVANGDIENAEKLGQYIKSKKGEAAVNQFGKAMQKLMFTNDINGGVQALGDYYNDHIDDGVDFTKGEVTPDGKINITVKNKKTGEESIMPMTKADVVRLGMAHDPAQLFKMGLAQVEAAEKSAAEIAKERREEAKEIRKEQRGVTNEIAKEQRTQGYEAEKEKRASDTRMTEEVAKSKLDAAKPGETARKIRDLREFGWDDGRISEFLEKSGGEFKKTTNPTERRALVTSDLMKNDPTFARMDPAKQAEKVDQMMKLVYGKEGKDEPAPAPRYFRDRATGQVGTMVDGKFVPAPRPAAPAK